MPSPVYSISDAAYNTIILHALKYPTTISGVVLGSIGSQACAIESAIPLIHSDLAMFTSPLHEVALLLSEQKAKQDGMHILGIYYANAVADDRSIGVVPTHLANAVQKRTGSACLLLLNAKNLSEDVRKCRHAFRVCVRDGEIRGSWGKSEVQHETLQVSDRALKVADAILGGVVLRDQKERIVDFEDHCADPSTDWLNAKLVTRLNEMQLPAS
ncbi:ER membrane protein complex subunit 8/9-like [Gracilariopsis chorda]|uniref:ER membrane protein complex subunit 8/9-like n=1 Tax=Gracilariopsis chorda TaxID=448386 RepID=A0A2V3J0L8_9FLOR|nr:ER membrane protein complex subunit 8/9-like [Gracilariopsis chorda]|eukprot:PXF47941.1 ER membrane protein complex subunit 8/9-like [Gracilariopsis chorda]